MLRLSPLIPFNIFNYLMGTTAIKALDYNFGHLGMVMFLFIHFLLRYQGQLSMFL